MKVTVAIALHDFRRHFFSPVAAVFLGVFVLASYFQFFSNGRFFARNLADLQPLFDGMPILLIIVVCALAMKGWAEETQRGQTGHLFSLPITTLQWVVGRFLGGLLLIGFGLACTLPLVVTAAFCGPVDPGPVVCGYFGAWLLGGTYLALGLALSAATRHQMVALLFTGGLGGALYLLGADSVTGLFSTSTATWLRAIGTSSRFENFSVGILDLYDILYFGWLTAISLTLNYAFLVQRPLDHGSLSGRRLVRSLFTLCLFMGFNGILFLGWSTRVVSPHLDSTQNGAHSLHSETKIVLGDLDVPILVRGIFSNQHHPKIAPFIPKVKRKLQAYQAAAPEKFIVDYADPSNDPAIQQEIAEVYGIISRPIRISETHKKAVVNAYFSILLEQGSNHIILEMEELLSRHKGPVGVEFSLRNLEYQITRALQALNKDAIPVESALQKLQQPVRLTLWKTEKLVPELLSESLSVFQKVGKELTERFPEKITFEGREFSGSMEQAQTLKNQFGIAPVALQNSPNQLFYLQLLVEVGDKYVVIAPHSALDAVEVHTAIEDIIRRSHPGHSKTVAFATAPSKAAPGLPNEPNQSAPTRDYTRLEQELALEYRLTTLSTSSLQIPEQTDVLVLAKPDALSPSAIVNLSDFLGKGNTVIALAGGYDVSLMRSGLVSRRSPQRWKAFLGHLGIRIEDGLLADEENASFPLPIIERDDGRLQQWVQEVEYPFFPEVRVHDSKVAHPVLKGLGPLTFPWASPVQITDSANPSTQVTRLLTTSDKTVVLPAEPLVPDFKEHPTTGFPTGSSPRAMDVLFMLKGIFGGTGTQPGTLIIIPSSDFASDFILSLSEEMQGEAHGSNVNLIKNLIDWSTQDHSLMEIRGVGRYHRKLYPMSQLSTQRIEWANYLIGVVILSFVVLIPILRRRRYTSTNQVAS